MYQRKESKLLIFLIHIQNIFIKNTKRLLINILNNILFEMVALKNILDDKNKLKLIKILIY